ncbi:MAG: hypothetical protein RBS17_00070 [Coriobacteriia bacterium]|nr:hypothetical protein [Coriobacteriia bacterium]
MTRPPGWCLPIEAHQQRGAVGAAARVAPLVEEADERRVAELPEWLEV